MASIANMANIFRSRPKPGTSSEDQARPLRLVYADEKGAFHIDPEAIEALQQVDGPVGVVSVCGRARQGKSFLLNQLLGQSSGFMVAPTHRPCTKGLWMWSKPIERVLPDGTKFYLVLLDSEGIDAYDQTGTYSTQIFSLAVLLSSMFVYNQMGPIDEAALDKLSLVTEMTKHIRVKASSSSSSSSQASASELAEFSPSFVWLLRDFYLDMSEDGRKITAKDYLETALQPTSGNGSAIQAKNSIRESIRALFPSRECFTLVRPMNDEADLRRLEQISLEKMRPEFRDGLQVLVNHILFKARPKQMGSTLLTGSMLGALTLSFLQAINAGAVPTISTSWQSVEESECRKAVEAGVDVYERTFDSGAAPEEGPLAAAHDVALQAAFATFQRKAVGNPQVRRGFEDRLRKAIEKNYQAFKAKVFAQAEAACGKLMAEADAKIGAASRAPGANYGQLLQMMKREASDYGKRAAGPDKYQRLVDFLLRSTEGPLQELVQRTTAKIEQDVKTLQAKYEGLNDRLTVTTAQLERERRTVRDWESRYEKDVADARANVSVARDEQATLRRKFGELETRLSAESRKLEAAEREKREAISKSSEVNERLTSALSGAESLKAETASWQERYEVAVREKRTELSTAQLQVEATRTELLDRLASKEREKIAAETRAEKEASLVESLRAQWQSREEELLQRNKEARADLDGLHELVSLKDSQLSSSRRDLEQVQRDKEEALAKQLRAMDQVQALERTLLETQQEASAANQRATDAELAASRSREKVEKNEELLRSTAASLVERQMEKARVERELEAERRALAEACQRAADLEQQCTSLQHSLEETRAKDVELQKKLQGYAEEAKNVQVGSKRQRGAAPSDDGEMEDADKGGGSKKQKTLATPSAPPLPEKSMPDLESNLPTSPSGGQASPGGVATMEYKKWTVQKLKQELFKQNLAHLYCNINVKKPDLINMWETHVVKKA